MTHSLLINFSCGCSLEHVLRGSHWVAGTWKTCYDHDSATAAEKLREAGIDSIATNSTLFSALPLPKVPSVAEASDQLDEVLPS